MLAVRWVHISDLHMRPAENTQRHAVLSAMLEDMRCRVTTEGAFDFVVVTGDLALRTILEKYMTLMPLLNERTARIWAATEARALGRGGVTRVMEATGMSRRRIAAGVREIESHGIVAEPTPRQRAPGRTIPSRRAESIPIPK